jgi:hypothetical protein
MQILAPLPNMNFTPLLGEAKIAQKTIERIVVEEHSQNAVSTFYLASAFAVPGDHESFKNDGLNVIPNEKHVKLRGKLFLNLNCNLPVWLAPFT